MSRKNLHLMDNLRGIKQWHLNKGKLHPNHKRIRGKWYNCKRNGKNISLTFMGNNSNSDESSFNDSLATKNKHGDCKNILKTRRGKSD